jgi:hypothetical protein
VARAGRTVDIELGPTGACGAHFPTSPFYALALLHEAATTTLYREPGRVWKRPASPPLAQALTWDDVHALSCIDTADTGKDATTARYILRAVYRSPRNWQPSLWTPDAAGDYHGPALAHPDPRWRAAHAKLQALQQTVADADLPHMTLRIAVTDERWCEHLAPGMLWDVYAFDEGSPMLV